MEVDATVANSSSSSRQQVLGQSRARHWSAFEGGGGGMGGVLGANAAAGEGVGERGPGGGGERDRERERELHKHGLIAIISLVKA